MAIHRGIMGDYTGSAAWRRMWFDSTMDRAWFNPKSLPNYLPYLPYVENVWMDKKTIL